MNNPFKIDIIIKILFKYIGSIYDNKIGSKDIYKLCIISKKFNNLINIFYPKRSKMINNLFELLQNVPSYFTNYILVRYRNLGLIKLEQKQLTFNTSNISYYRLIIYYLDRLGRLSKNVCVFKKINNTDLILNNQYTLINSLKIFINNSTISSNGQLLITHFANFNNIEVNNSQTNNFFNFDCGIKFQ